MTIELPTLKLHEIGRREVGNLQSSSRPTMSVLIEPLLQDNE